MDTRIEDILKENERRNRAIQTDHDTCGVEFTTVRIGGKRVSLPVRMCSEDFVQRLIKQGFVEFAAANGVSELACKEAFVQLRCQYDFIYWCKLAVKIKPKDGGENIPFILNRPQKRLARELLRQFYETGSIRLILLKARQWGGSTLVQIFMAWLQLVHFTGLNSNIVAHVKDASIEVKGMFDTLINNYPSWLLGHSKEKQVGTGSENIKLIPARNCKIKIGTAERPDSARGGDSALVHCTEVAFWKKTDGKTPSQIVRSAIAGATAKNSMVVYESTANGVGNFFHTEYEDAKSGKSAFTALFIPWYEIERYSIPFSSEAESEEFARMLYDNREATQTQDTRAAAPAYLWKLWVSGATLEAIKWYINERKVYIDDAEMAAEYPSDDIEAFSHSGARVFDRYLCEKMRESCMKPLYVGDLFGDSNYGPASLDNLHFTESVNGAMYIWEKPEIDDDEHVKDRYITVVDVGGRSGKSDYSVITVFDRYWLTDGGKPTVVAQWYGHAAHYITAWKAAQVAKYFDNALLVYESNTLETDTGKTDGDQSVFILDQIGDTYSNIYMRETSVRTNNIETIEKRYGFHTNTHTKPAIISNLEMCINEQKYIERDNRCIDEYLTYERSPNGKYSAIQGRHDDMLMTRAIGLYISSYEMDIPKVVSLKRKTTMRTTAVSAATII